MVANTAAKLAFVISETSLGAVLRERRGTRSLRDMSTESNVDIGTLSRIERDLIEVPSRDTLAGISRAYGLPLEMLAQLVYCGSPHDPAPATPSAPSSRKDLALAH